MENFQLAPPDDPLYVAREADAEFERALREGRHPILIHGGARTGKTALLARGLKSLQAAGRRTVLLDLAAAPTELMTTKGLCRFVMREVARQLGLSDPFLAPSGAESPDWDEHRGPLACLERYLRRRVLSGFGGPFYFCLGTFGKLPADARADFSSLIRSWHNERALDPDGVLGRMQSVIASTADHVWAARMIEEWDSHDDGGFAVGTTIRPADLTDLQVAELNRRAGSILPGAKELDRFYHLVGGQPFLVRSGLEYLRSHGGGFAELEAIADDADSPWAEFMEWLGQECDAVPRVRQVIVDLAVNRQPSDWSARWAAHALGLLADHRDTALLRCDLYRRYFARRYGA